MLKHTVRPVLISCLLPVADKKVLAVRSSAPTRSTLPFTRLPQRILTVYLILQCKRHKQRIKRDTGHPIHISRLPGIANKKVFNKTISAPKNSTLRFTHLYQEQFTASLLPRCTRCMHLINDVKDSQFSSLASTASPAERFSTQQLLHRHTLHRASHILSDEPFTAHLFP